MHGTIVSRYYQTKFDSNLTVLFSQILSYLQAKRTMKFLLILGFLIGNTNGHGYTTISRNFKCKVGLNDGCGDIQYEPQSLEALKGFPNSGPPDGKLASAGICKPNQCFDELDVQGPDRWHKTNVQAGPFTISWHLTANHRSTSWKYFLTKQNWNPSAPLSRSSFDLEPFCTVSGGGSQPPFDFTHSCNLPVRTGYQVILAVWTIDDTVNAFYNMNDVIFGSGGQCESGLIKDAACCAASCGSCGGSGCSKREGGAEACCSSTIMDSGRSCDQFPPPCVIVGDGDPTCATGIRKDSACCASSCGKCGGIGCSSRSGGADACCTSNIIADSEKTCDKYPPPCVIQG